MSASAAEIHFAAEFVTFLAAAVGLAVALLRGDLLTAPRSRVPLAVGFCALGTSAFLHGSLLLDAADDRAILVALRAIAVAGIAFGASRWAGPRQAGGLLWGGVAVLAVAAAMGLGHWTLATSAVLAAGSLAIGFAVVVSARRSIASRVAASASLTLLLVVLVLAVGISAVLSNTVEDQARQRLATRAGSEAKFVADPARVRLVEARLAAASLKTDRLADLQKVRQNPNDAGAASAVAASLDILSGNFFEGREMLYIDAASKAPVATTAGFPVATTALAGSPAVSESITQQHPVGSITEVSGRLVVFGTFPLKDRVNGVPVVIGVVVTVSPVDAGYFQTRIAGETGVGVAAADRHGFLAAFAAHPAFGRVAPLIEDVFKDTGKRPTGEASGRFFAAAPVLDSAQRPVAAVVVSQPTSVVADTREQLYRVLFLIALGGTLLALALAALVGSRIGAGLRQLTLAAEAIQGGDFSTRAGVQADDEVGMLGAAFDSMAGSIQEKTGELQHARIRLEAVVAGMGEALVATDEDGNITDFNRSAEELLGISAAEAKGRGADSVVLLRGDDGASLAERLRKPSPRRWSAEGTIETADGSEVPVAVSAGALRGLEDELAGQVFVLRDLRGEREVERMKTEFLSRIGHELRTPLTGITGYAELLTRKDPPPDLARQWHHEILKQSRNLLRIVQMLEFFASTGANRAILRPEVVDVREVVDEAVNRRSAKLDGQWSIKRRVARGVPKIVADERWLRLAIDELVDNAVKFSPDGGTISVTASTEGNRVEIAVADRGKGMTREEQARAFTEFVQGDTSDTRMFGGLGLGLSLVQRVAEAHGGSVACTSTPGKGSKFSIFLPVGPIEERR
ncbi:MAG: two-component system, OmpR family, sensor histidine kinase VicK [Acidimicrobiaceae bacterium]|nr:two-component system, OmpR family, sensor histidine kinase VicK [Acidimicrobiaceae bacterium]